jgi:phage shock protein A
MSLLRRASRLLKANINHLLDSAEDPELMIKQLIHEMDESVGELRRETVNAVARQKQLEKKVETAGTQVADLEKKAALALDHGDEELARQVLGRKVEAQGRRDSLVQELEGATKLAKRIKTDLLRMQEQSTRARVKKDEMIRRKRSAEARLKTQEAARRSSDAISAATDRVGKMNDGQAGFDGYADAIHEMEARAEADRELSDTDDDSDRKLQELSEKSEVDEELERLKKKRAANG